MKFESLKSLRLKGIGKFIHSVFMFLTYPFRHGFKFLGLLFVGIVILAAIPMSQGVSYKHIFDWYMLRYDQIETKINTEKRAKPEAIEREVKTKVRKEFKFKETAAPDRRYVSAELKKKMDGNSADDTLNVEKKEVKRKTFNIKKSSFRNKGIKSTWTKKTEEKPYFQEELQEDNDSVSDAKIVEAAPQLQIKTDPVTSDHEEIVVPMPEIKNELSYRKVETLPIIYIDTTEHIEGTALVFGANDLSVDDKYVILYGIYTNSYRFDIEKAASYLRDLVDKKNIECEIVAYTYQNYPTAICFLDGVSINQHLVDAGFADNIAL